MQSDPSHPSQSMYQKYDKKELDRLYGVYRPFSSCLNHAVAVRAPVDVFFLRFSLNSTSHNIFPMPPAAFPHYHRRSNDER